MFPYYDTLIHKDKEHPRVILCGWHNKHKIAEEFKDVPFSHLGNLYSNYGVEVFLSNLSKMPYIKQVYCFGNYEYLKEMLCKRIQPKHFDSKYLNLIAGSVCFNFAERFEANSFPAPQDELIREEEYREPFDLEQCTLTTFPSEENGFVVQDNSIPSAWTQLVQLVMRFGKPTKVKYGEWKELSNVVTTLDLPSKVEVPKQIRAYVNDFIFGTLNTATYTYHNRLHKYFGIDQLYMVKHQIRKSKDLRIVASLWDPLKDFSSDTPPCLINLIFRLNDNKLSMTAVFRSHDIFRAWKFNAYALNAVLELICDELQLNKGKLSIISSSAHIYPENFQEVTSCYEFIQDPRGNFLVEPGRIKHFSPKGDLLQEFVTDSIIEARRLISPFISRPDHALYIGEVLARVFLYGENSCVDV